MKATHTILALIGAALALPLAGIAIAEGTTNDQAIDDVVVVGEKTKAQLRREIFESEEDFYALYNQLNDDDEYDVRCFYETPTGTRIKNHVCRAKFMSDAFASHAARNRNSVSRVANQEANPVITQKTARFQEKLETLIAANPDLQEALARYNAARARYMAKHEESANN